MNRWRMGWRIARLALHIVSGVLLTLLFAVGLRMSVDRPFYQRLVQWWLGRIPVILGVKVTVRGEPSTTATLCVANHISWLDIPVLGGVMPLRFLSKQEVRGWPLVGWLAAKSGTLFITRGKAGAATAASSVMASALRAGHSVLLFPEGTTTTGDGLNPFHARLFAPALEVGAMLQPVVVRYPGQGGLTNPVIPYVGDQGLWENLQAVLGERGVTAEVILLPPLAVAGHERKGLAALCEQQIRENLRCAA